MNFFSKFFKKPSSKEDSKNPESKFLPKKKDAIEERFILKFIENGGKFLCCENLDEVQENFNLILKQLNKSKLLKEFSHPYKKPNPIYYCLLPINDKQILIKMEEGSDKLRLKKAIIQYENQKLETLIEELKKQKCD